MKKIILTVQGILGSFILYVGALKLSPSVGPDGSLFQRVGLPHWSLRLAGGINILGGAGMVLGIRRPVVAFPAALLLTGYFLLGLYAVLGRKTKVVEEVPRLGPVLIICLGIAWFHHPAFMQKFQQEPPLRPSR